MPIRILIADDHRLLRAGLKSLMSADANLEVVGEATNGEEAVQLVQNLCPDIVLMDISMPGMDGLEATRWLKKNMPRVRVLVLSMHEDGAIIQEFIRAGANGYIIKRAAESELIDAIYAVWRGMIYIHPSLMHALVMPSQQKEVQLQAAEKTGGEPLTQRETEILGFIVKGYTNKQVADALSISVRTVETHRSNIMDKLNLHTRLDLVRYASENGLM